MFHIRNILSRPEKNRHYHSYSSSKHNKDCQRCSSSKSGKVTFLSVLAWGNRTLACHPLHVSQTWNHQIHRDMTPTWRQRIMDNLRMWGSNGLCNVDSFGDISKETSKSIPTLRHSIGFQHSSFRNPAVFTTPSVDRMTLLPVRAWCPKDTNLHTALVAFHLTTALAASGWWYTDLQTLQQFFPASKTSDFSCISTNP